MPEVDLNADDTSPGDDKVVKVTAQSLDGGEATWYLGYGDSIELRDDAPSKVTVEASPFESELDDDGGDDDG